ncbi:hypothetical protein U0070_000487, partial [Myodes glareolus]
ILSLSGEPGGRRGRHDAGDVRLRRGQRLLLDDESDPFDILREAEHRRQQQLQRKRRDEAAEAASGVGHRGGRSPAVASGQQTGAAGRRESQKERKSLVASSAQQPDNPGGPQPPGQKRTPRRGEQQQGWNDNRGTDALDRAERRSYREYRLYDTERKADLASEKFTGEKPVDRFDRDRPLRGRGGPRGGLRSRGRGGPGTELLTPLTKEGNETLRDTAAMIKQQTEWRTAWVSAVAVKTLVTLATCTMEEILMMEESQGTLDEESPAKVPELEIEEENQMSGKKPSRANQTKPEFNIRKPESTVPSKAVVIHKSRYRDEMVKDNYEDESHLEINFGNLPRPGRGARGSARGGRGRIRRTENYGPRAEVVTQDVAPNRMTLRTSRPWLTAIPVSRAAL